MIMLDTSFVVAYFNTRDQNHDLAIKTAKTLASQNREIFITDYIFGEIVTVSFLRLKNVGKTTRIGKLILASCNLIYVEKNIFEYAWEIFSKQNLRLSFTDCTTIAAMQSQKIQKIATFDSDFTKVRGVEVL
jgi:predicted nucleic acid-binding protein